MSITDQLRREVAARLRRAVVSDMPTDIYEEQLEQDAAALERIIESVHDADRVRLHGAPYSYERRQLLDVLADLIDRPACHAVQPAPGGFYECSRCGYDGWADESSVTRYCPECGAEVAG